MIASSTDSTESENITTTTLKKNHKDPPINKNNKAVRNVAFVTNHSIKILSLALRNNFHPHPAL